MAIPLLDRTRFPGALPERHVLQYQTVTAHCGWRPAVGDDEMSRADAASWLVRIANDLRCAGDMPLVRMNANGVEPASMSLADELWLVAFCLDADTATHPSWEARRG